MRYIIVSWALGYPEYYTLWKGEDGAKWTFRLYNAYVFLKYTDAENIRKHLPDADLLKVEPLEEHKQFIKKLP